MVGIKKKLINNIGWLYVLPIIIIIIIFKIVPLFDSIRMSFFSWDGWTEMKFVGLKNYIRMFTEDDNFPIALKHSLIYQFGITAVELVVASLLAIIIDFRIRFWRIYRVIFFLPFILSAVVVILFWGKVFEYDGLLNNILISLNLENLAIVWLFDPNRVQLIVTLIISWQYVPFSMIFILAGLQNIDNGIYEAAKIDGINNIQRIFKISLPLIKHVLMILTVLLLIANFRMFEHVLLLTGGGPNNSTQVLGTLLYKYAFNQSELGYASVIAVVSISVALTLGIVYVRLTGYSSRKL